MQVTLNLHSHAFMPSDQLCSAFLLPTPPQFLYQAPPGAQQLTRPDFPNVLHMGHPIVLVIVEVMADVAMAVLPIRPRIMHTVRDIDPGDPSKISVFVAFE